MALRNVMALRAFRELKEAVKDIPGIARAGENDDAFTMADEDFLMTHMLNCVALLAAVQREQSKLDIPTNLVDARVVRNKVFLGALSVAGNSLLKVDQTEQSNAAVDGLMKAFSVRNNEYLSKNEVNGWLPLHYRYCNYQRPFPTQTQGNRW